MCFRVKYDDSPQLDVRLTNIIMDTADVRNTGLGSASYVEDCQCPSGMYDRLINRLITTKCTY